MEKFPLEGGGSNPNFLVGSYVKSGGLGIISSRNQEKVVLFPYNVILGRETALPSPLYHSDANGFAIIPSRSREISNLKS